ncbi:MAG: hypothetical protein Q9191_004386 [Dirinaria sp. TL-2023a]
MAAANHLARSISWPPSAFHSIDEYSPLLHKASEDDFRHPSPPNGEPPPTKTVEELDTVNLILIMMSLWLDTFTSGLDGTIMATLAAPISTEFNSLSLFAWLATAYIIGSGAAQPLSGRLTDIFSRQWGRSKWTMIIGRVVAGAGGGSSTAVALMLISDLIPSQRRGLWQGVFNTFWGLGNGLGGLWGGYINDTWDWRVAFLAQIPLTLISLTIVSFRFHTIGAHVPRNRSDAKSSISRIDFLGSSLLVSALVLFLLGITVGGNVVPWSHPLACAPLPLSFAFFCAFIYVERSVAREPILPLHYLKVRTILCACLTTWFFHLAHYTIVFYVPIYYRARGASTTRAGTALIPIGVTFPLGSLTAGLVSSRTGRYKEFLRTVTFLFLLGTIGTSFNSLSTPLWLPPMFLVLIGFAFGGMLNSTLAAFTTAVERVEQALVISLGFVFRSTGAVMGIAIGSAVYQGVLERNLSRRLGSMDNAADIIQSIKDSLDEVGQLPESLQVVVRNCYMVALRSTFSTTVVFAILAVVSGFSVKQLKMHSSWSRDADVASVRRDRRNTVESG